VKKQIVLTILKYGLALALLAWVLWDNWSPANGSPGLADVLHRQVRLLPLFLALGLCLATVLLTFVRWFVLVRAQDLPFTLRGAVRLGFIGFALSSFLPGSVGGDIIKAACLARQQDRRTVAVATVLIDRLVGLCGLFWLVALVGGVLWAGGWLQDLVVSTEAVSALETIVWSAGLLAAGSLAFWLLLGFLPSRRAEIFAVRLTRIPKVGGSLAELWRAVWMYRCRGLSVGLALLLAILGHSGVVIMFYCGACSLCPAEAIPSLGTHFLLVPVGITIQAGVPLPGGIGGAELGFGWLYQTLGFASANGVLASLVQRVVNYTLALVGYLVYLRMRPTLSPAAEAEMPELAVMEV
jgi:uncharacterized membrane protein YbhN (UPF0104 family)